MPVPSQHSGRFQGYHSSFTAGQHQDAVSSTLLQASNCPFRGPTCIVAPFIIETPQMEPMHVPDCDAHAITEVFAMAASTQWRHPNEADASQPDDRQVIASSTMVCISFWTSNLTELTIPPWPCSGPRYHN